MLSIAQSPGQRTVVVENTSRRYDVRTEPLRRLDARAALRNTVIGGAVGGALAGVSYLGKIALPVLGRVSTIGGVARLAGAGAGIGLATAVLPVVWPRLDRHPVLKSALTGAGIGAAAGTLLPIPLLGPISGALVGATIGATTRAVWQHRNDSFWNRYPAWPPYGMHPLPYPVPMPLPMPMPMPYPGVMPGMAFPGAFGHPGMLPARPGALPMIHGAMHRPLIPAGLPQGVLPMSAALAGAAPQLAARPSAAAVAAQPGAAAPAASGVTSATKPPTRKPARKARKARKARRAARSVARPTRPNAANRPRQVLPAVGAMSPGINPALAGVNPALAGISSLASPYGLPQAGLGMGLPQMAGMAPQAAAFSMPMGAAATPIAARLAPGVTDPTAAIGGLDLDSLPELDTI